MAQNGATRHPQKTPIYVHGRSTPIGYVEGQTFHQTRKPNHFMTTPPGIAFDRNVLADAERAGAVAIRIVNSGTGTVYTATVAHVWRWGRPVDRGYGSQIGLPFTKWAVNGRPVAAVFENNQAVKAAQPSLFGGMG